MTVLLAFTCKMEKGHKKREFEFVGSGIHVIDEDKVADFVLVTRAKCVKSK